MHSPKTQVIKNISKSLVYFQKVPFFRSLPVPFFCSSFILAWKIHALKFEVIQLPATFFVNKKMRIVNGIRCGGIQKLFSQLHKPFVVVHTFFGISKVYTQFTFTIFTSWVESHLDILKKYINGNFASKLPAITIGDSKEGVCLRMCG